MGCALAGGERLTRAQVYVIQALNNLGGGGEVGEVTWEQGSGYPGVGMEEYTNPPKYR